jgi:hypothetical protein
MGGGTAVLDMLTVPVATAGKTLTGVTLTDTNGWGNLQIDFSGLTADFTPPAPPVTIGGGSGKGHDDDRAENDQEEHASAADKAEKDGDKAEKHDIKDSHKAAVKPASKKSTTKKSDDHERNGDD